MIETLLDRLGPPRCERAFGALKLLGQFLAHDGQFGRRFDADAHAAVADFYDGDRDLVADQDPLANFSTEY
jgi:hypothetical protein